MPGMPATQISYGGRRIGKFPWSPALENFLNTAPPAVAMAFEWRKVVFAIAISLLFVPMVYLGVNTFFPAEPQNTCYPRFIAPPCKEEESACWERQRATDMEMQDCQLAWEQERKRYEGGKYIVIMLISIAASLVMLLRLEKSIVYGLFFGVVITAFTGTLRYIDARSVFGFGLMVALFALIIAFVQRERS